MRRIIVLLLLMLTGCTSAAKREAAAEARGFERGYGQAVKEQYWIIQSLQRQPGDSPKTQQP